MWLQIEINYINKYRSINKKKTIKMKINYKIYKKQQ